MELSQTKISKCTIITVLSISLFSLGCSSKPGNDWQEITGHDMSYSAKLPKEPTYNKQEIPTPHGTIVFSIYELITKEVKYTVGCYDYPDGFLKTMGRNAREIFDSSLKPTVKKLNAKILEKQNSFFKGFPRQTTIMIAYMEENSSNVLIRQDSYLVKGRMYIAQTLVLEDLAGKNKEAVEYFHDSFAFEQDNIKRDPMVTKTVKKSPEVMRIPKEAMMRHDAETGQVVKHGTTIINVPDQYRTIQEAIDAAQDGDIVVVKRGHYYENVSFLGKNIVLQSTKPHDSSIVASTIIDCQGSSARQSVVTFSGQEDASCTLKGFTITGGDAEYGGGINGNGTYASIVGCVITGNKAKYGGGIANTKGVIASCSIRGNQAQYGPALYGVE